MNVEKYSNNYKNDEDIDMRTNKNNNGKESDAQYNDIDNFKYYNALNIENVVILKELY